MSSEKKQRSFIRRVFQISLRGLLFFAAIVAVFTAIETNRFYNQQRIVSALGTNMVEFDVRYPWLEKIPISKWMNERFGDFWNRDITAIQLYEFPYKDLDKEKNAGLFLGIARLKRLQVVNVYASSLSEEQLKSLTRLKSLQWLLLVHSNVEQDSLDYLRAQLPNTYVTCIPKKK